MEEEPNSSLTWLERGPRTEILASNRSVVVPLDLSNGPEESGAKSIGILFEPLTAATVAMWLAEGAVSYIGGLAMSKILGDPSLSDIATLIRSSIEEIKTFIRQELQRQIDENEIRVMKSQFESVIRNLKDFDLMPKPDRKKYRYLLENAFTESGVVMSLASKFEMNGIFVYANSTSTRILALAAQSKLDGVRVPAAVVKRTLTEARDVMLPLLKQHEESWLPENRISEVKVYCDSQMDPRGFPTCVFSCYKDGQLRQLYRRAPTVDEGVDQAKENFRRPIWDEAQSEYLNAMNLSKVPLLAVLGKWEKLIV